MLSVILADVVVALIVAVAATAVGLFFLMSDDQKEDTVDSAARDALFDMFVAMKEDTVDAATRDAIFDMFVAMTDSDSSVASAGVEADWVALRALGHAVETRVASLPASEQAEVVEMSERVAVVGAQMVKDGFLDYFRFSVPTNIKLRDGQKTNPPRSLFVLAPNGRAEVLRRRSKRKSL